MGRYFLRAQVGAQDVGLDFLDGEGLVAQGIGHAPLPVHGFLHTQGLGNLAEDDAPIEGGGVQMGAVIGLQQEHAGREDGAVELLADDVVEQDGAGAEVFLHADVIGQVHGDVLITGVGIAAIIDDIAGVDVGLGAGDEVAIGGVSGQGGLQFRQTVAQILQGAGAVLVLQEDVCAVGSLDAITVVVNGFGGAYYDVHLAVGHFQPGTLGTVVAVCLDGMGHLQQVLADAGFDGDVGRSGE